MTRLLQDLLACLLVLILGLTGMASGAFSAAASHRPGIPLCTADGAARSPADGDDARCLDCLAPLLATVNAPGTPCRGGLAQSVDRFRQDGKHPPAAWQGAEDIRAPPHRA